MGWITRHFGRDAGNHQTDSSKRHLARRAKKAPAKAAPAPYRAVTVYSRRSCCEAAQRLAGRKFLAAHAPQLPLGGCTQPDQCACRYHHLEDRRQEIRRDTDHGLPSRAYGMIERRNRGDRRRGGVSNGQLLAR